MNRLAFILGSTLAVSAVLGAAALTPQTGREKSISGSVTSDSKSVTAKNDLGAGSEQLVFSGRLDRSDDQLSDESYFETRTATFRSGDRVDIRMTSSEFDTYLILVRETPEGLEAIAEDDDSGSGLNARIQTTIEEAGEYAIICNGARPFDLGAYELSISIERSSGSGLATSGESPAVSQSHRGRLSSEEDSRLRDESLFELVRFEGERGQLVEVHLMSDDFDTYLMVGTNDENGDFELLAENDDFGLSTNSRVRLEISRSQTYVIVVNGYGPTDQGAYELRIDQIGQAEQAAPLPEFSRNGDPKDRYAVLVGIDDYPGRRSDLGSCVVDTLEMRDVLVNFFGFDRENILLVHDNAATRENIITAIREFLGQVGPEGVAVLYYSGHGLQLDDVGRIDEEDGKDEAIYVWGPSDHSSLLLDEEIGYLIDELGCERTLAILDSCHSGTGTLGRSTKAVDPKDPWVAEVLQLPGEYLDEKAAASGVDGIDAPERHVLFAAARDDQKAHAGSDGRASVFTYYLVRAIRRNGPDVTLGELIEQVHSDVTDYIDTVLELDDVQEPQLEGVKLERTLAQVLGRA